MAGFNEDDRPDGWKKAHEELYGPLGEQYNPTLMPNPERDLLAADAEREEAADYLIAESAQLMHYYSNRDLPEWVPGAEPWLN